jgi:hypothetical protein
LTRRQVTNRCARIRAALDLLDTLWLERNPSSYPVAVGPTGYLGQARRALADLESNVP